MHSHSTVAGLGLPEKDEAGQRANATGPHATTNTVDSGQADAATQALKRFANAQARAALAGVALARTEGDDGRPLFIASRWALTKTFDSIAQVEVWLDRVAGAQA